MLIAVCTQKLFTQASLEEVCRINRIPNILRGKKISQRGLCKIVVHVPNIILIF